MTDLFEGANILRIPLVQRHDDRTCAYCDTIASYTVHGPDDSYEHCPYHLAAFLIRVVQTLERVEYP